MPLSNTPVLSDHPYSLTRTTPVSLRSSPERAWGWLIQLGRGAGYYVFDRIVNGARPSADYLLEVPQPIPGDYSPWLGDLVNIIPSQQLLWKNSYYPFSRLGITWSFEYILEGAVNGSQLISTFHIAWNNAPLKPIDTALSIIGFITIFLQSRNLEKIIDGYPQRKLNCEFNRSQASWGHQRQLYRYGKSTSRIPTVSGK